MMRGDSGMAGGGIYFATSVSDTNRKAQHHGVIIRAEVKLGNTKAIDKNGDASITFQSLADDGFDSVMIPRDNGKEYVVYNFDQVRIDAFGTDGGSTWQQTSTYGTANTTNRSIGCCSIDPSVLYALIAYVFIFTIIQVHID